MLAKSFNGAYPGRMMGVEITRSRFDNQAFDSRQFRRQSVHVRTEEKGEHYDCPRDDGALRIRGYLWQLCLSPFITICAYGRVSHLMEQALLHARMKSELL